MKFEEIQVPTIDMSKVMDTINAKIDKYPKGSLSPREVVESINLGDLSDMTWEEAQKAMDELNAAVTKTIQGFVGKIAKAKNR